MMYLYFSAFATILTPGNIFPPCNFDYLRSIHLKLKRPPFGYIAYIIPSELNCFAGEICFESLKPHVGINVLQMQTKFKSGYGDNLFKKKLPAGEIYAGVAINDYFGINVGYYSSVKKKNDATLMAGDFNLGYVVYAANSPAIIETTSKITGAFVDLEGNIPVNLWNLNLFATIGIENTKVKLRRDLISYAGIATTAAQMTTELKARKTLFRLNTGIIKSITPNLAMRALVGWKNLSNCKISGPNPGGLILEAKLNNNINYGIGLQYTFN